MTARIEWAAIVSVEGCQAWKPKVVTVGDDKCVKLTPSDFGLVSVVATLNGVTGLKSKERPSLTNCKGYLALKQVRNRAQAKEIDPGSDRKKLFDDEAVDDNKKRKRSANAVADLRVNPQLFAVDVGIDGSYAEAWMQRPISSTDDIVVKADDESLSNVIKFIAKTEFDVSDLYARRAYRSSGEKGVWKFGDTFYVRDGKSYRKVAVPDNEVSDNDEDAVNVSELPDEDRSM